MSLPTCQPSRFTVLDDNQARVEAEAQLRQTYGKRPWDQIRVPLLVIIAGAVAAVISPTLGAIAIITGSAATLWLFWALISASMARIPPEILAQRAAALRGGIVGKCPRCGQGIVFKGHLRKPSWTTSCPICGGGLRFNQDVAYPAD